MHYLEIEGERITVLSQDEESEPFDTSTTEWDDFKDALGWAVHESYEREGKAVDVVSEEGTIQARVSIPSSRGTLI